jgi:hypothetical protein
MSSSLNNFCESLVNGSNPRYTYSQPSIAQQVAWQVQKEQESFQAAGISSRKAEITWKENNGYYVSQLDSNYFKNL